MYRILLYWFLLLKISNATVTVTVKTNLGEVIGKEVKSVLKNEKYYSFLGIPYAEPPIGKLRFMPPEPHSEWDQPLDATKEKKHCAQNNLPLKRIKNHGFCGSEDCLHLSIHTPKLPNNTTPNLPVIIFLYSLQFRVSYNASKEYGPDFFMKEDVIIVTLNHRLGALGFLSFEDDLLPGNNGIRDVILAIRWIKENIFNFGGDPNRITLMGNEDGAALVDILLHSPQAKGLFHGAILQSGTSWNPKYFTQNPRKRANDLSEDLKLRTSTSSTSLVENLSQVSAMELVASAIRVVPTDEARSIQKPVVVFGPVIEHDHPHAVISNLPENKSLNIDVPLIIGYNSRESLEYTERFLERPQYLTYADRDFLLLFPIRVDYHFKTHDNIYNKAIKEIKNYYFDKGYVQVARPGEYITYLGDIFSFYALDYTVRKYVNESSKPVYYYTFDYSGDLNMRKKNILENAINIDGTWGASLGDELCYLFVCKPFRKLYEQALNENSEEINVLMNMIRLWTNFAKHGNPTPSGKDFTWKPATKANKECLVINDGLEMKEKLHEDRIQFWDQFINKYGKLAVGGIVKDIKDEL